ARTVSSPVVKTGPVGIDARDRTAMTIAPGASWQATRQGGVHLVADTTQTGPVSVGDGRFRGFNPASTRREAPSGMGLVQMGDGPGTSTKQTPTRTGGSHSGVAHGRTMRHCTLPASALSPTCGHFIRSQSGVEVLDTSLP